MLIGSNAPPGYEVSRPIIWTFAGCFVAFSLFLGGAVLRARLRSPATGKSALIGQVGTVRAPLQPTGMVFADGELWTAALASGEEGVVPIGTRVVVVDVDRLRLTVRRATERDVATAQRDERRRQVGDAWEVLPSRTVPSPDRPSGNI